MRKLFAPMLENMSSNHGIYTVKGEMHKEKINKGKKNEWFFSCFFM